MDMKDFSEKNRKRCEHPKGFNHALNSWSVSDWFTAVLGELGEAANVAKKLNRVRDGIPGNKEDEAELRAKLARELADVFIYFDLLCQRCGVDLPAAVQDTFFRKSLEIGYESFDLSIPGAREQLERSCPELLRIQLNRLHAEQEVKPNG
jgi:NTP pyrophosphatase (non-canonical NTP hydrolase)